MNLEELAQQLGQYLRPGVPKYVSLRDAFVGAIANGSLKPGDKVPNEQALAAALPMSLGTIQRALRDLATSGVIERRPAHGSFIKGQIEHGEMAHPFHCRFIDDDGTGYLPVYPEVLSRQAQVTHGEWNTILRSDHLLEINRRIRIADEFYVHTAFYVDAKRFPSFEKTSVKQLCNLNFKDLIFRATGRAISSIEMRTRQDIPPRAICKAMDVTVGTVCLSIRATGFLSSSDPVYYQRIYIPPTTRELHILGDPRPGGME